MFAEQHRTARNLEHARDGNYSAGHHVISARNIGHHRTRKLTLQTILQRLFAFLGAAILIGLCGIALMSSVGAQSVLIMFAAVIALSAVAGSSRRRRF